VSVGIFFVVKVMQKFIRKAVYYNRTKVERNGKRRGKVPVPHAGDGSEDLMLSFFCGRIFITYS
jgi:hypothetical protein